MALNTAPVDRSLWQIAELSARCSDPSWPGNKEQAWSALQEVISDVRTLVLETTAAIEAAELRAARAEGRIRVVRRERDRERAGRRALWAAAEAARETATAARQQAEASQAWAAEAQAALDAALGARAAAEAALRCALERSEDATAARTRAEAERDEVQAAYLAFREARDAAEADRAKAVLAAEAATAVEAAGDELERTVAVPADSHTGLAATVPADSDTGVAATSPEPGFDEGEAPVVEITAQAEPEPESAGRYLHVGATMGHLLPDDLAGLLVEGAALVRREGRLAALISVPSEEGEWAAPTELAEDQAQRLAAEGFRVQWVEEIFLAS